MNTDLLFLLAAASTWAAFALLWRSTLGGGERAGGEVQAVAGLVGASLVLNLWALHLIETVTAEGINFTLAASASLATLIVQGIYLIGLIRHGVQGLGLFLLPATGLALAAIPMLPEAHEPNWVRTSSLLETGHLLISLVGYAVLTLAAVHALMQLILDRKLKRKEVGRLVGALPSLVEIERHMMAQVRLATVLIGLSILTGLVWQWESFGRFALLNHKVLLALFAFGVLVLLLVKRSRARWPASLASRVVLTAYGLLLLAYYGVKLVQSWLH